MPYSQLRNRHHPLFHGSDRVVTPHGPGVVVGHEALTTAALRRDRVERRVYAIVRLDGGRERAFSESDLRHESADS